MIFVKNLNLSATHIAVIIEDFHINSTGKLKCQIPILMPNIPQGKEIEMNTRLSKSNLINKNKSDIMTKNSITTINYLMIDLPSHIRRTFTSEVNETDIVLKGKKIIITFIEDDINHIKVLGRY